MGVGATGHVELERRGRIRWFVGLLAKFSLRRMVGQTMDVNGAFRQSPSTVGVGYSFVASGCECTLTWWIEGFYRPVGVEQQQENTNNIMLFERQPFSRCMTCRAREDCAAKREPRNIAAGRGDTAASGRFGGWTPPIESCFSSTTRY